MAEGKGAKVLCLGALNKAEWMNNGVLANIWPLHINPVRGPILYHLHP